VVHDALETLKDPEKKDDRPSIAEICEVLETKFRKSLAGFIDEENEKLAKAGRDLITEDTIVQFVKAGHRIVENLYRCDEINDAQVLFCEHPLMQKMDRTDDVEIKFKGFIDLVIKTKDKRGNSVIYIIDYKTCSWGWNGAKRRDEDLAAQLRLYKHFFSKEFKLNPKNVKCAFVLCKRTPKGPEDTIEWLPVSAGPKTVARSIKRLNVAITGMNSNDYKKNRKVCVNVYGDTCPYFNTPLCTDD
jgi:ATP-dependent exoDNAse (exonuclease V) beta subunit